MLVTWNNLPHWLRAMILGNLVQFIILGILRLLRDRYRWLVPVFDRVGPKSLRSDDHRRAGGCLLIGILWFALSFYVGHQILRLQGFMVAWMLRKLAEIRRS